nr:MAG TPA: hypothetical protein [Caudoviricetes sp.]
MALPTVALNKCFVVSHALAQNPFDSLSSSVLLGR